MDDDMEEVQPDHLEKHWKNMSRLNADVSSGVPDEIGTQPINREKMCISVSHVFPTNDSLASYKILLQSGIFDERMDRGQSEDHELGIRLFKNGGLMLLDPTIRSIHLRAMSGGLREHGARKITQSSARKKILHRRLPHKTELYLQKKHFPKKELKELINISVFATFSYHGNFLMKITKIGISLLLLPNTLINIKRRQGNADRLIGLGPQVPKLGVKNTTKIK